MNLSTIIKQNPVVAFIILTLGLSFAVFLIPVPKENAVAIIGFLIVPIPTLVAFGLVAVIEGRQGVSQFRREVFDWHVALKWVGIALALGFVVHLGGSILALATGRITRIEIGSLTVLFIVVFPLALLEEIGWRGFALRRLLDKQSPFAATLMIGIPWALLHFVLFVNFVPDGSPVAEMLVIFAFAVLLTWIYVSSGRKVLAAAVLHGALNGFGIVTANIPAADVLWFVFASASIIAVVLLWFARRMWFIPSPATGNVQVVPLAN